MRSTITLPRLYNDRGDTIVEVLIAVAIVSVVLVSAYSVTNRNVQSGQAAQEQGYAQKLVQQQIELLRSADVKPTGQCLDTATGSTATNLAVCKQTIGGATYTLSATPTATGLYAVKASWDVLGGGKADVTMYYRTQ